MQEYDSHRLGKIKSFRLDLEKSPSPSPVFVQVFIPRGLGVTIGASCATGGFVAVFVGEEKTSGGRSGRTAPHEHAWIKRAVERQRSGSGQTCVIITRKYRSVNHYLLSESFE